MDFGNGFEDYFPLGSLRNPFKYTSVGYLSCVTQFMISTSITVLAITSSVLKIISSLLFFFFLLLTLNGDFYLESLYNLAIKQQLFVLYFPSICVTQQKL